MDGFKSGQTSIVLRVKLYNSSVSTGAGLTGLTSASAGLIISTIADNEATATAYTQAGGTIETITTLGTFAAPTATKCRFKELDATNHKGVYEIQIADARFAVANAKSILISWSGATNLAEGELRVPLTVINPYSIAELFTTAMVESYGADGATLTPAQALYQLIACQIEENISGTAVTFKKRDGSTTAFSATLNAASGASAITQS
jgi:hypothetical protein